MAGTERYYTSNGVSRLTQTVTVTSHTRVPRKRAGRAPAIEAEQHEGAVVGDLGDVLVDRAPLALQRVAE